jgi:dolichol-phosphate mannosyltransferase
LNGISVVNWPLRRIILSQFANFYIRTVTGLRLNDITGGYRCWRREALATLPLERIVSDGYAFLLDVTFMAADAGLRIVESPIIFVERRIGASKLSSGVLIESLITPWKLILRHGRIRSARSAGSK